MLRTPSCSQRASGRHLRRGAESCGRPTGCLPTAEDPCVAPRGDMVSGRPIPLPAGRPAPELVTSSTQLQQELTTALSELRMAKLSRRLSGGLRHELVPAPASI